MTIRRLMTFGLAPLAIAGLVVGCGSSTKSSSASTQPPTVDIVASGDAPTWSFSVPSGGITGGVVTLRLTNHSKSDAHDLQLARVDGDHTADDVKKIVGSDDNSAPTWLHGYGGIPTARPGQTSQATLDLPPGHYFFFCNDDSNGTKHATHGMFGELDVKGDSGAHMPKATAQINAKEYAFDITGLHAGANTVEFSNVGKQLHMALMAPLQAGKTLDDARKAMSSNDQNEPPPFDFDKAVGTEVLDPGRSVVETWDLAPGKYVILCFMSDHDDPTPHFSKGMLQEVDIA